jgi:hypothetical protein
MMEPIHSVGRLIVRLTTKLRAGRSRFHPGAEDFLGVRIVHATHKVQTSKVAKGTVFASRRLPLSLKVKR